VARIAFFKKKKIKAISGLYVLALFERNRASRARMLELFEFGNE
jgi:hypothetical protein